MKKTISSRDFWYALFGISLVLIVAIIGWRVIVGKVKNSTTTNTRTRNSYLLSPSPSPSLAPTPSPSPSPSPTATASATTDTKGGLKVATDDNGTTYVTTETTEPESYTVNADDDTDTTNSGAAPHVFIGSNSLPQGYFSDETQLVNKILTIVMMVSALLVLYQLVMGGFGWLLSGGDKGKIDQARSRIINAIVGIIIVAASYAIFVLVLNLLGTSPEALNSLLG